MGWQVQVGPRAADVLRTLDAAIRDEIIVHIDELSDAPAEFLRRSRDVATGEGRYVSSFESTTVPGLTVTLVFAGFDEEPKQLVLVSIGRVMG